VINMRPLLIAHRGASGYLPEHTLAAKQMAHEMGADYLEQDLVASRDDELIVLHDIHLDRVTNVADRFPGRKRQDGRFYVRDFDLAELRTLSVWERMRADGSPVFPNRYPPKSGDFGLNTLAEEIELIHTLNDKSGRDVGIYPEIKRPNWHREHGVDIAPKLLQILGDYGYETGDDPVYVQCFDDAELRRIRHDLDCPFKLVQLIGGNSGVPGSPDYDAMRTAAGLAALANTVDGIGPYLGYLYEFEKIDGMLLPTELVQLAHAAGLAVHPYTFRADDLPPGFATFEELLRFFIVDIGVDGLFTDFPDQVLALRLP
jgi:glycerophosphoryl diester phosphodiesterase